MIQPDRRRRWGWLLLALGVVVIAGGVAAAFRQNVTSDNSPATAPTVIPTLTPTPRLSWSPTVVPTTTPSPARGDPASPTLVPTLLPTGTPTLVPSVSPTLGTTAVSVPSGQSRSLDLTTVLVALIAVVPGTVSAVTGMILVLRNTQKSAQ
jgi:hypothetical protein